jgi:predicted phosphodiesterase
MIKKAIVLSDLHVPYVDIKALNAVEKYLTDEKWDYVIYLGDIVDFDEISHWNADSPRKLEGKRISYSYEETNKMLDRHERLVKAHNKNCEFIFFSGNHSARMEKYIDKHPELEGLLEVDKNLHLKKRGYKYIKSYPNGEAHKIGDLMFHHGIYGGATPAKKMVETFDSSIMFGHLHNFSSYSKMRYNRNKVRIGYGIGCLARYDQEYIGRFPSQWQQGFGVAYFRPDGKFNVYPVVIDSEGFVAPNGKHYSQSFMV